jgi:UDP-2-acetamido-2-deoxy-ribo-hexuluronate aminotransferase
MSKINFIELQLQYQLYKEEINKRIQSVLDSSQYIQGQEVALLEQSLQDYTGAKHAIGCSSGTDALLLAMMAIGIKPGDEVITSPFTFIATAEVIALLGAKPVFVDIDEETYNIDVTQISSKISDRTKAIIPVSLFGQVSDMKAVNDIAEFNDLIVIEDAAQSFGAEINGVKSCNLCRLATTSFFPAKPLGCYGDGGAVFTDNDHLNVKIRQILNHGQTERYVHSMVGINGRLDSIQAAVLNVKLKYYQSEVEKRQIIAEKYSTALKKVLVPTVKKGYLSVWAQYCIRVNERESLRDYCSSKGIPTAVYYPTPLHLQEVFTDLGYKKGDFPISEKVSRDIMALPMSAFLKEEDQQHIIGVINDFSFE